MRPASTGRVFVLGKDDKPRSVPVTLGLSDGVLTEVSSDELTDGTQVITGVILAPASRSGGPKMSF
jgi:multidrug efflux pump subunit AcrA (membrane-fusion protein)